MGGVECRMRWVGPEKVYSPTEYVFSSSHVGGHRHSVQTDGSIPLEKKGNRDPFASRSLAAFARYVGHPKVIIQGDSEHSLMAVIHDACAPLTCEQQKLKWSSRESSTFRRYVSYSAS